MNSNSRLLLEKGLIPLYKRLCLSDSVVGGTVELLGFQLEGLDPSEDMLEILDKRMDNAKANKAIYKTFPAYIEKEKDWYLSRNRSLKGSKLENVEFWHQNVASKDGQLMTNSNYGWYAYDPANGFLDKNQFDMAKDSLIANKDSRQAVLVFMNPMIHWLWNQNGMHDFVCTFNYHFMIRNNRLQMIVSMRSNDVNTGFKNDFNWACYVYNDMLDQLRRDKYIDLEKGTITWQANSFHCYERDFEILRQCYLQYGDEFDEKEIYEQFCQVKYVK